MPVIHHGPWGLERRIRILFMVLWQAGSSDVPGPCPNLPALTLHPQSCEVKLKDKVSPKLCCLFMVTTYKNCFTGNKTRNKFYILLPGSQKRWSLSKFQLYFLFQWFTIGKMRVHIHLAQVTVGNSPELKSQVFKMETQTARGLGSRSGLRRSPRFIHLEAVRYHHCHPAPALMEQRPLKCAQRLPDLNQEFGADAEHA